MKKSVLLILSASVVVCGLSGCVYIKGDADGHTAFADEISKPSLTQKFVTFSLNFKDDSSDHFCREGEVVRAIETEMKDSGMFSGIQYIAKTAPRGNIHYEYTVRVDGPSYPKAVGLGILSGLTFSVLPIWMDYEADWLLAVYENGKEVYINNSEQEMTYIQWLPCALAFPYTFMQEGDIKTRAINYFLKDIQNKQIHK